jgi:uncharacterized protein (UPF0335 family)
MAGRFEIKSPRERLVFHVQELERLVHLREMASADLKAGFAAAQSEGYDPTTLRVVLKLRTMSAAQRQERRALEAIYMAALGMLDGESLPEEARRRLDGREEARPAEDPKEPYIPDTLPKAEQAKAPEQQPLIVKDPAEARQEGADAAAAGQRVYDNPYRAGDPCRAAWDEGWCSQQRSHGMDTPAAYQRRSEKKPKKDDDEGDAGSGFDDRERGAA